MSVPAFAHTVSGRLATFEAPTTKGKKAPVRKKGAAPVGWPHAQPSSEELAKAGFYYAPTAPQSDNVRCFLCCQNFDGWEETDNAVIEHFNLSPNCGWAVACHIGMFGPFPGQDPLSERAIELRTATFDGRWPHDEKRGWRCKTKKMVEAGWSYDPSPEYDDCAKCFYCDLTLDGWEPKDDPWKEHDKRAPQCPFFTLSHEMSELRQTKTGPKKSKKKGRSKVSSAASSVADDSSVMSYGESTIGEDDDSVLSRSTVGTVVTTKPGRTSTRVQREEEESELTTLIPSSEGAKPKSRGGPKKSNAREKSPPPTEPSRHPNHFSNVENKGEAEVRQAVRPTKAASTKTKAKSAAAPPPPSPPRSPSPEYIEDEDDEEDYDTAAASHVLSEYLSSTQLSIDPSVISRGLKRSSVGMPVGMAPDSHSGLAGTDRAGLKKQRVSNAGVVASPDSVTRTRMSMRMDDEDQDGGTGFQDAHSPGPVGIAMSVSSLEDDDVLPAKSEMDDGVDEMEDDAISISPSEQEEIDARMDDVEPENDQTYHDEIDAEYAHTENKENSRNGSGAARSPSIHPPYTNITRTPTPPTDDDQGSPDTTPTPHHGRTSVPGATPLHRLLSSASQFLAHSSGSGPAYVSTPSPLTTRALPDPVSESESEAEEVESEVESEVEMESEAELPHSRAWSQPGAAAVHADDDDRTEVGRMAVHSPSSSIPPSSMMKAMTGTPFSAARRDGPSAVDDDDDDDESGGDSGSSTPTRGPAVVRHQSLSQQRAPPSSSPMAYASSAAHSEHEDEHEDEEDDEEEEEEEEVQEDEHVPAWEPVDLDSLSLHSAAPESELPARLRSHLSLLRGTGGEASLDDDVDSDPDAGPDSDLLRTMLKVQKTLSQAERDMTLEEWVVYNAERGEERLRWECERLVGLFEREGGRAMEAIEAIVTVDG